MPVGDAGEDRDHLVVAFEGVNIDRVTAISERRHAGTSDKILDARVCEHIGKFLFRHS